MKQFKDFNIKTERKSFVGDKIKIERLINRKIIVHDFKIVDSKFEGKRLDLQIEVDGRKNVVFTSAAVLREMLAQLPEDGLPFETTISNENDYLEFT